MNEKITYISQLVPSFERASECLEKLMKIDVSATTIQIISEENGKSIHEKDMDLANEIYNFPEKYFDNKLEKDKKPGRLYIMADGSAVNTRLKENGTTWKEMKLGLVFSDANIIKRKNGDGIITKKEYISYMGSVEEFKKLLFACAIKNGYGTIKEVVVVGDGAKWIWKMCEELFPDAVKILDFYHMSENIYSYAKYLYPNQDKKIKKWSSKIINLIKKGEYQKAMKLIPRNKSEELPSGVPNLSQYIENNKDKINYNQLKKQDYIIGSGAMESANKMVIHQRLKQSGMRWNTNGAQYISTLRTKYESNLWCDVQKHIAA